ncbi:MAG: GHKL domain-containing protein [Erysipelotrichales bacterium]|nr:GHKL domain-containing protein [Erysipelotrichales bacterium]
MMVILSEYLFCLLYTVGVFICTYPYLETRKSCLSIMGFLFIYGLVDFIITGDYILQLHEYLIYNLLVIISDFIMICIYERKYKPYIAFYTTFYFCIYMVLVNSISYLSFHFGFRVIDFYDPSIARTVLVIIYNVCTIMIFKLLIKIKIIPDKRIVNTNWLLFNTVNVVVLSAYIIFFGFSLIEIDTILIIYIFVIFIILWLCLLKLINKTILLNEENNQLELINMANKNSEILLENFNKEREEIKEIKHDLKNHFNIINSLETIENIREYVEDIRGDLMKVKENNFYTGNATIDAILSIKYVEYSYVHFIVEVDIKEIKIIPKDIASILFNLIDNAVENASLKNKDIHISIVQQNEEIVISISNHVDEIPSFKTKKGKEHGYGLKIVRGIVQKYQGDLSINIVDDVVIVHMILKNIFLKEE